MYANKTVGNLEGLFSAEPGNGAIRWIADCHGDHYGVYSDGTNVYSTGHEHSCETANGMPQGSPSPGNMRNATVMTAAPKGTLLRTWNVNSIYADWSGYPAPAFVNWYPDWITGGVDGGQAGWTATGAGDYLLIGGEQAFVNGQRSQGITRFSRNPSTGANSGPRLSGANWVPVASSTTSGKVRVSIPANWDRDDLDLTYRLIRNGGGQPVATTTVQSTYWSQPQVVLTDTQPAGTTPNYRIVAVDGDGNVADSADRLDHRGRRGRLQLRRGRDGRRCVAVLAARRHRGAGRERPRRQQRRGRAVGRDLQLRAARCPRSPGRRTPSTGPRAGTSTPRTT